MILPIQDCPEVLLDPIVPANTVKPGIKIAITCRTNANPPPINFTLLHDGKIVGMIHEWERRTITTVWTHRLSLNISKRYRIICQWRRNIGCFCVLKVLSKSNTGHCVVICNVVLSCYDGPWFNEILSLISSSNDQYYPVFEQSYFQNTISIEYKYPQWCCIFAAFTKACGDTQYCVLASMVVLWQPNVVVPNRSLVAYQLERKIEFVYKKEPRFALS